MYILFHNSDYPMLLKIKQDLVQLEFCNHYCTLVSPLNDQLTLLEDALSG